VAEWLRSGLQSRLHRFDSGRRLYSRTTDTTRSYRRFSQALKEIVDARVCGGIHFRSADEQGAAAGAKLAAYVGRRRFGPTR
jgi:hypothetical protein